MYRVIDKITGRIISLENASFEATCPECGKWHTIDPLALAVEDPEFNFTDFDVYCDECGEKHQESGCYE